jgi:hypothetical protein
VKRTILIAIGIMLVVLAVVVCSCTQKPEPDYAGAITENMLQALNTGDYALYSEHFDEAMQKALPESVFKQSNTLIRSKIGNYVSKQYTTTQNEGQYISVYYKAKFSAEPGDVTVKVVFQRVAGKTYVAGFWMNSPNLGK